MAFCIKCGAENPVDAAFCYKCGEPTHAPPMSSAAPAGISVPAAHPPLRQNPKRPVVLIALNLVLLMVIEYVLIFVVPVFGAMFADFGATLPSPTQRLLDWSNLLRDWRWGITLNLLLVSVVMALKPAASRSAPRLWLTLSLLLQSLLLGAMVMSMFLPIFQLGAVAGSVK